ncbi:MAG: hypothetical protein GY809_12310 [Planctomycetes bacterium]|nr:hypothetical protein [Planctomycetota bacterium]
MTETRGRHLRLVGYALLYGVVGAMLGFYMADRGARWFPTMVDTLLLMLEAGLLLIIGSRILDGSAVRETAEKLRTRKRVILAMVVLSLATVAHLGSQWMKKACPLTELSPAQFAQAFDQDRQTTLEITSALNDLIALLEAQPVFKASDDPPLTADQERLLRDAWQTIYHYAFALDGIRQFYEDWYRFDPSRAQRSFHVRSFLLTFAAEAALYEKSSRIIDLITRNDNAVKFLDAPQPDELVGEYSFSRFREQLQGSRDRARIVAGTQYLLWLDRGLKARAVAAETGCQDLWDSIRQETRLIAAMGKLKLTSLTLGSDLEIFRRSIHRVWYPAQKQVACFMGNTRVRRIGTYLTTPQQRSQMDNQMTPGDIMLSRKNWYLSNVGLPGFWPHAILYIGAPDKFEAYFDDPDVLAYVKSLSDQNQTLPEYLASQYGVAWLKYKTASPDEPIRVIESIKHGVLLNSFEQAFGDYMVALRPRLSKVAKAQAIIEAFSHLGKPYDFYFDFATDHALVCTELVWRSYRPAQGKPGLTIALKEIAGRRTLPANEFARLFAQEHDEPDRQLDFVMFYDAHEKEGKAFESTEEAFLKSHTRQKWSFMQD